MDGENNGKPYFLMDDLGVQVPLFSETSIHISITSWWFKPMPSIHISEIGSFPQFTSYFFQQKLPLVKWIPGFKRRQKMAEIAGEADPARTLRPYAGRLKDLGGYLC